MVSSNDKIDENLDKVSETEDIDEAAKAGNQNGCESDDKTSVLNDMLLRKAAELENLRKRLEKEKEDAIKYSNARFARDLLTIVDNIERLMDNSQSVKEKIESDTNLKALFEGVLLCKKELISIFKKHGISKIETNSGDAFDPEYHQAMCELDDSDREGIVQVFQAGYQCNGRLLRPAMVSVSKKSQK